MTVREILGYAKRGMLAAEYFLEQERRAAERRSLVNDHDAQMTALDRHSRRYGRWWVHGVAQQSLSNRLASNNSKGQ